MARDFFGGGRSPIYAREAVVATSHPLATAAGLDILRAGGNAVDAALAAVATQCVVEPHMTGIGGDCFVLYVPAGADKVIALNGSGRAPQAASAAYLRSLGLTAIDRLSAHAVTVPGAIAAWTRLHKDYGSLPLEQIFRSAIAYAEDGYPISPRVAADWRDETPVLINQPGWASTFLASGSAPAAGDRHAQPRLGARLRAIARDGAKAFYLGEAADSMVALLRSQGGLHTTDDFASMLDGADYVAPISSSYRGYEVVECPPNGQGLAALIILNILDHFDMTDATAYDARLHVLAEATKLAYHQRDAIVGDPATMTTNPLTLLEKDIGAKLAARIDPQRAMTPTLWTEPEHKDTVYLCVVDRDGNAISFINSTFHAFGSGIVDEKSGVVLHSRGSSFRLLDGHPNAIGPRKRPLHTIIPGMLRKNGETLAPFGVMGGHYQAAGHAAFVSALFDRGLDPQAAIDEPRLFAFDGVVDYEPGIGEDAAAALTRRGHVMKRRAAPMGGGQAIMIDRARGVLIAGSDPRKDGCALGY